MSEDFEFVGSQIMPTNLEQIKALKASKGKTIDEMISDSTIATDVTSVSVSFLSRKEQLEALLPPGKKLTVQGQPVVSVTAVYQGALLWLAGRGYNLILVNFPVAFRGKKEQVIGSFNYVVWENMTEPILGGRETLGWPKIYAEIPPARVLQDKLHVSASWYGFNFLDMSLENIETLTLAEILERQKGAQPNAGIISHKYVMKTGHPEEADADYLTISTQIGAKPAVPKEISVGKAKIQFHKATWEQLPTMSHIINKLADLEVKETYDGVISKYTGGSMGAVKILE